MKKKNPLFSTLLLCLFSQASFAQYGWQQKGATTDIETTPATNDAYVNHDLHILGKAHIGNIFVDPANGAVTTLRFNSTDYLEMYGKSGASDGPGLFMFNNTCPTFPSLAGDLQFWTNGSTRVRIDKNGVTHFGNAALNPFNGAVTTLQFNSADYVEMYSKSGAGDGPGLFMFNNTCPSFPSAAGNLQFWTNGSTRMSIDKNGVTHFGNVSLNPFNGAIKTLRFDDHNSGGYTEIYGQSDAAHGSAIIMGSSGESVGSHGGISFWAYNDVNYNPSTPDRAYEFIINHFDNTHIPATLDQQAAMVIHKDGKVMIGAGLNFNSLGNAYLQPNGYKLIVQEGILTEKLKVANSSDFLNWSDFVFDEDYSLMPLKDVESYISQHKHLPEIPSAADVHKDGIDVAAMDAKLLQKIEELTLYVIQQQKKIEALEQQVKKQ